MGGAHGRGLQDKGGEAGVADMGGVLLGLHGLAVEFRTPSDVQAAWLARAVQGGLAVEL